MMDCKKALNENDGDLQKAIEWLRQKGLLRLRRNRAGLPLKGWLVATSTPAAGWRAGGSELRNRLRGSWR